MLGKLYDDQKRDLPQDGKPSEVLTLMDVSLATRVIDLQWNGVFKWVMSSDARSWAKEAYNARNKTAHRGLRDISDDDAWRALDTLARLASAAKSDAMAEGIRALQREARYGSSEGSMATAHVAPPHSQGGLPGVLDAAVPSSPNGSVINVSPLELASKASGALPSWRDVMEPHPDVAQGRYSQAEFAADLAQVAAGKADAEYQDPVEFFGRTYVTEGMKGLLVQSLQRVSGLGGEPVIQLKTAFGGGKTHSMLALYHLLRGKMGLESVLGTVGPVLAAAGLDSLPSVPVAVVVGTYLNPAKSSRPSCPASR